MKVANKLGSAKKRSYEIFTFTTRKAKIFGCLNKRCPFCILHSVGIQTRRSVTNCGMLQIIYYSWNSDGVFFFMGQCV